MSSDKQIAANRTNALRSTGPRTSEGKQRSKQNAHKHGLSNASNTTFSQLDRIEMIANEMTAKTAGGDDPDPWTWRCALRFGETQVYLESVKQAKAAVLRSLGGTNPLRMRGLDSNLKELTKFEGYERKGRSRRKLAVKDLLLAEAGPN